jgi:hypothetical protein
MRQLVFAEGDATLLIEQPVQGFRPGSEAPKCAILGDFRAGVNEAPCGGTNALIILLSCECVTSSRVR